MENKKQAVLSLSGGMDSSTLLLHLLANGYDVTAISFDYGQKHFLELQRAQQLVTYVNDVISRQPTNKGARPSLVKHQVISIQGLGPLLNSALVKGGAKVPEGHYAEQNMKATVVPNRNKIFASITQAVALSVATQKKTECVIALGVHSGDHAIYPDCTEEFRQADMDAFRMGNWESHLVDFYAPYMNGDKFTILQDGQKCCKKLGLDFDEVYKRTNTSYDPNEKGEASGKTGADVERVLAFHKLGKKDPVAYAGGWSAALAYALTVEEEFNKTAPSVFTQTKLEFPN
jgi:7-cyano-7-deazaguanine synthase